MQQPRKRMMYWSVALLSTLLVAVPVMAEPDQEPLEFGYINLPPFGFTDNQGRSKGYLVALARRVFEAMDEPVRFIQHPATRLYRQVDSGKTAFTLAAADLNRLNQTAVESSQAAMRLTLALYRRKGTDAITELSQLKDQHVVLMKGYSYGELGSFLEREADNMRITEARSHKSALRMIQFGRADYLLNYQTAADTTIAQERIRGLEREVISEVDVQLFVSRALENAQSLADEWDHHLRSLRRNDQLPPRDYYEME